MPRQRCKPTEDLGPGCPVEGALEMIGGKWKGVILYLLLGETLRFNELRRRLPHITQRMLTNQLRQLEADGLVARTIYPVVPPRVEYSLTPFGRTLDQVILALETWGRAYRASFGDAAKFGLGRQAAE